MNESCCLASSIVPSFSQQLEFKARIVQYRSDRRATTTVRMTERPQFYVVRRGTGSSNARNPPTERFALLIFEMLLTRSGDGLTSVPLHCDPRRTGYVALVGRQSCWPLGSARPSDIRSNPDKVRNCEDP